MRNDCIILFKGGFQYNVVNYFIDELAESFDQLGLVSLVIDFTKPDSLPKLQSYFNDNAYNIKCLFSFNGIGLPDIGKLAAVLRIPFVNFYVDAAIYHLDRLAFQSEYLKIVFVDKAEVQFAKDILKKEALYIPHGACTKCQPSQSVSPKKGIIFAGSITKPEKFRQCWLGLGKTLGGVYDTLLEFVIDKECFNIIQDVDYILKLKGYDISQEQKKTLYFNSIYVHRYIRSYRRLKVLEALKDFEIDLFGNGWDSVPLQSNHKNHGALDFLLLNAAIKQAQIVINVLPEFVYGGHERLFTAMYHGTAVVTNSNVYLRTNFKDGQDLLFYSMRDLARLPHQVAALLEDDSQLAQMAQQGQAKVAAAHTWLNRAQEILKLIESN